MLCFSLDAKLQKTLKSVNQVVKIITHHIKPFVHFVCCQHRHCNHLEFFIKFGDPLSEFVNDVFLESFFFGLVGFFFHFVPLIADKQSRLGSDIATLPSFVELSPFLQDSQKLKDFKQNITSNQTLYTGHSARAYAGLQI